MLRIHLCVFFALLISGPAFAASEDLDSLLIGVGSIAAPGAPDPLAVFGRDAFPVIVGKSGKGTFASVVAAGRLGKGRILAFGHNGYLAPEAFAIADTGRLFANAIAWTGRQNDGKRSAESPLRNRANRTPRRSSRT
ncbi:MAG: hypothetical protein NTU53_20125 [Planctomycetota bacterium]|nr:hypothetical protein [Planctomycetota bacterium]